MGGVTASVKVKDEGVKALFKRLKKRGADTAPVMRVIGELVRSSVLKNFEEEGRPRWKPSAKPLIDTSRLLGSCSPQAWGEPLNSVATVFAVSCSPQAWG